MTDMFTKKVVNDMHKERFLHEEAARQARIMFRKLQEDGFPDGNKGKKNIYLCPDCGHGFVSIDVDDGVTPLLAACLNCGGRAISMFYSVPQEILADNKPAVEWYRPESLDGLSDNRIDHVCSGGLLSRRVDQ